MVARKPPNKLAAGWGSGDVSQNLGYENQPLKAALYIRVSTAQQVEGDSLEEQESELRKFCDFRQFQIHQIYIEKGRSGKNTQRPEYQKLLKDIEAKKIQTVIVKKLDRLSRSLLDFESLILLMQTHGVEFISLRESFDTTTAMGKAMLRVALVFAQLEREQTAERISDVMQYRASLGLHNGGHTPFGYTCVNKEWVVFNKEKEILELIFKRFREVKSTVQVTSMLNDMNIKARRGKLWDCRRILDILQNPACLGHRKWKDQLFKNTHPPIITDMHFQEVAAILKKRPKVNNLNAPLQKLLTCGTCASPLTPSYSFNHAKIRFYYYRCTRHRALRNEACELKQIGFSAITNRIKAAFDHFTSQRYLNDVASKLTQYNKTIEENQALIQATIQTLEAKQATLKEKQNSFLDSLITGQFTAKERQRINTKLEELDLELKQVSTQLQHQEFTSSQQESNKVELARVKYDLAQLQELDSDNVTAFRAGLTEIIKGIVVNKTKLIFYLHVIPWELDFDG